MHLSPLKWRSCAAKIDFFSPMQVVAFWVKFDFFFFFFFHLCSFFFTYVASFAEPLLYTYGTSDHISNQHFFDKNCLFFFWTGFSRKNSVLERSIVRVVGHRPRFIFWLTFFKVIGCLYSSAEKNLSIMPLGVLLVTC